MKTIEGMLYSANLELSHFGHLWLAKNQSDRGSFSLAAPQRFGDFSTN
jgi:hypothetical protein